MSEDAILEEVSPNSLSTYTYQTSRLFDWCCFDIGSQLARPQSRFFGPRSKSRVLSIWFSIAEIYRKMPWSRECRLSLCQITTTCYYYSAGVCGLGVNFSWNSPGVWTGCCYGGRFVSWEPFLWSHGRARLMLGSNRKSRGITNTTSRTRSVELRCHSELCSWQSHRFAGTVVWNRSRTFSGRPPEDLFSKHSSILPRDRWIRLWRQFLGIHRWRGTSSK